MTTLIKTSSLFKTVDVTAKELFRTKYSTGELFTPEELNSKLIHLGIIALNRFSCRHYKSSDGIMFYLKSLNLDNGFTTIDELKPITNFTDGNMWKFGFVDEENGSIKLLFDGCFVANDREEAKKIFNSIKPLVDQFFGSNKQLFAFSQ